MDRRFNVNLNTLVLIVILASLLVLSNLRDSQIAELENRITTLEKALRISPANFGSE